jgi:hypothetical protein
MKSVASNDSPFLFQVAQKHGVGFCPQPLTLDLFRSEVLAIDNKTLVPILYWRSVV